MNAADYIEKRAQEMPEPDYSEHALREMVELLNADQFTYVRLTRIRSALYAALVAASTKATSNWF